LAEDSGNLKYCINLAKHTMDLRRINKARFTIRTYSFLQSLNIKTIGSAKKQVNDGSIHVGMKVRVNGFIRPLPQRTINEILNFK
jgi:hypothetical protein